MSVGDKLSLYSLCQLLEIRRKTRIRGRAVSFYFASFSDISRIAE